LLLPVYAAALRTFLSIIGQTFTFAVGFNEGQRHVTHCVSDSQSRHEPHVQKLIGSNHRCNCNMPFCSPHLIDAAALHTFLPIICHVSMLVAIFSEKRQHAHHHPQSRCGRHAQKQTKNWGLCFLQRPLQS